MLSRYDEIPPTRRAWFRQVEVLSRIAYVLSLLAGCVALIILVGAAPIGGYIAVVVALAGVVVSRRHQWTGLLLVLTGVVLDAIFWEPLVIWTMAVFTVFAMALRGASVLTAGVLTGAVAFVASVYAHDGDLFDPAAIAGFFAAITAAAMGNAIRNRDKYWTEQEERARDAVAAREGELHRRVVEERMRIARDLHDVVGHEISVISINLGVAEVNLPAGADRSQRAIDAARAGVQAVLSETQNILSVLRERADDDSDSGGVPSATRLPELVESFRSVGLVVDARLDPDLVDLDPAVDVTVYRILQEALTNAQRHGSGDARVHVSSTGAEVRVEVSNGTRRAVSSGEEGSGGYGLVGMRERVASVGGSVEIVEDENTFTVRASIPLEEVRSR